MKGALWGMYIMDVCRYIPKVPKYKQGKGAMTTLSCAIDYLDVPYLHTYRVLHHRQKKLLVL